MPLSEARRLKRRPLASRSIPRLNINTNTNTNTIPRLLDSTNQPRKERPSSVCLSCSFRLILGLENTIP
jgi:hypothetical protein